MYRDGGTPVMVLAVAFDQIRKVCISASARPITNKHTHHHSPRSPDFCPIRAILVGEAAAMVVLDAAPPLLALWPGTGPPLAQNIALSKQQCDNSLVAEFFTTRFQDPGFFRLEVADQTREL